MRQGFSLEVIFPPRGRVVMSREIVISSWRKRDASDIQKVQTVDVTKCHAGYRAVCPLLTTVWLQISTVSRLINLAIENIKVVNIANIVINIDTDIDWHGFRGRWYIDLHLGICAGFCERSNLTISLYPLLMF